MPEDEPIILMPASDLPDAIEFASDDLARRWLRHLDKAVVDGCDTRQVRLRLAPYAEACPRRCAFALLRAKDLSPSLSARGLSAYAVAQRGDVSPGFLRFLIGDKDSGDDAGRPAAPEGGGPAGSTCTPPKSELDKPVPEGGASDVSSQSSGGDADLDSFLGWR